MTTVFPGAVDALPRPGALTWMDDTGFEGDTVIDNISDAIEAMQSVSLGGSRFNPIVNAGFDSWQDGATFTSIASGTWGPDNFIYAKAGAIVHDLLRSTDVPTVAQSLRTTYSLHLDVTTADASLASTDFSSIATRIEGYAFRKLDQKIWSFGFWVKAAKTGVHYVYARNSGSDRSCVMPYTIIAADTWEYKTITFPANPSAGTWDYTNGRGLEIGWTVSAGSSFLTTAGAWQTGDFKAASGVVNEGDNSANNFKITMIGPPTVGAIAAPFGAPDVGIEQLRCFRYYFIQAPGVVGKVFGFGQAYNTSDAVIYVPAIVPMRAVPSFTISSVNDFALSAAAFALAANPTSITLYSWDAGRTGALLVTGGGATLVPGNITMLLSDADSPQATLKYASRIP